MQHNAAGAAGAVAMGFGFMLFMVSVGIGLFITWIISLMDVLKNEYEGENTKTIWILLLLLIAPLGTILYQVMGKKQKQSYGNFNGSVNARIKTNVNAGSTGSEPNTPKLNIKSIKTETCSQCGNIMKERTVMSGEKTGQKFLVCSKYPDCRFISPLAAEQG